MLGPYRVPARRHDSVWINGIFERFVKTLQGMVIERVHIHHGFLEHRRGAILAPAVPATDCDQFFKPLEVALVGGWILGPGPGQYENEGSLPETRGHAKRAKQRHF